MTTDKSHRVRRIFSVVLIVIASVLAPLLVTTGWAVTTVTNTDRFVSTMSALGHNTTITNYVAAEGAESVVTSLQVQARLEHKLPTAVAFLAPLVATELTSELTKVFSKVLQSPKFQQAWDTKVRLLHSAFVRILTTSHPAVVSKASKVALNFTPQVLEAITQLDHKGITFFDPLRRYLTGDRKVLITLADQKQFQQLQWYFNAAIKLRWILPLVFLVLAAAAILLHTRRRRAGTLLGIGVAISCSVMLVLLSIGRQYASTHAPTPPDVANAIFSTFTSFLRWELRIAVLLGAAAALVLWFTGPSSRARRLRGNIASTGGAATKKVEGAMGDERAQRLNAGTSSVLGFMGAYAMAFIWAGIALACLALVVWVDSFSGLVWTVVLTALWVGAFVGARRTSGAPAQLDAGTPSEPA